jgi:hypothetical protein
MIVHPRGECEPVRARAALPCGATARKLLEQLF